MITSPTWAEAAEAAARLLLASAQVEEAVVCRMRKLAK
jgi:hypothetical protein